MIPKTNLAQLRLMDFFQVASNIAHYARKENLETLKLAASFTDYETALDNLDKALKRDSTKFETQKLNKISGKRRKTISALTTAVRAFCHSPEEGQAQKAQKLLSVIEKYGKKISGLPLREETAAITNLLQDFKTPEIKALIDSIGLSLWVTSLETYNTEFDTLYKERSIEQASHTMGLTKDAREKMQKTLNNFAKTMNSLAFLEGETPYKNLADCINNEINKALSEVKRRKNSGKDKDNSAE
ncbi:DUF6261 family protein [Capnocytophaga felis]|uniref:Uncharacterized protein n=1 Tax=Capnocytophaga felis TaxID=2267611 RepID=A0A5M4B9Z8_9FLAO|nr:DUF6261 family protein [Capnocytophaga felis]GET46423.1 hypothetical protein RCZ01_17250 [Capnocytophaga felis]GET48312.1 hypothetical protein RCZ02_11430 [Capnocytophaga felis]